MGGGDESVPMNIAPGSQVPLENGAVHRLSKGSHNQGMSGKSLSVWLFLGSCRALRRYRTRNSDPDDRRSSGSLLTFRSGRVRYRTRSKNGLYGANEATPVRSCSNSMGIRVTDSLTVPPMG